MSVKGPFLLFLSAALLLTTSCSKDKPVYPDSEIVQKIRHILTLPTHELIYRDIVYLDESKTFLLFKLADRRVLFSVNIRVQAGIDLEEGFRVRRISPSGIKVTLPAAKILLIDAEENSIEQFFSKEMGGPVTLLSYYEEIERKKPEIEKDALSRGILTKAESNAQAVISSLLETLGFTEIYFEKTGETGQ